MTVKNEPLPKGWREVKIIDFSPLQRGFDLPAAQIKEGTYPVVYSNGIKNYHSEYKAKAPGVVTGRSGTIGEVTYVTQDYWPHNTSLWVTDFKGNHPKFVFYFLQNLRLDRFYAGSGVPTLNRNDVHKKSILIPTLPEQKAIASLLEKWDTAIEKTEALIGAKEKRFKWLLKTLISDQQDNPEWQQVKLVDTCEVIVSPVDKKTVDGELPVKLCNYTDVYYNNAIDSKIDFMAATAKPREIEKFSIIPDDVIITKDSETPDDIGVPAYVKETIDDLLCGYHLTILRPKKQTIGKYMCYALTSPRVKYDFYRFANGITRFGLTKESYQKIKIPLPLPTEQKRIANILDTAEKEVEFLNQLSEQYRTQKRGLMQKLLTGEWRVAPNKGNN